MHDMRQRVTLKSCFYARFGPFKCRFQFFCVAFLPKSRCLLADSPLPFRRDANAFSAISQLNLNVFKPEFCGVFVSYL